MEILLTERQKQVMALEAKGYSQSEISRELKVTPQSIRTIRMHPNYIKCWNKKKPHEKSSTPEKEYKQIEKLKNTIIREEIKKQLDPVIKVWKESALPAAEKIVQLSQFAKEEALQFQASKEVVNQAGYVPEKKVTTMSVELTGEDAERISQAFKFSQTRTREIANTGE